MYLQVWNQCNHARFTYESNLRYDGKFSAHERRRFLIEKVAPLITKQDTRLRKSISAQERLAVTLRFLASGESFEDLKFLARISPHSISKIVMEVCAALIKTLSHQMKVCKMIEYVILLCTFNVEY